MPHLDRAPPASRRLGRRVAATNRSTPPAPRRQEPDGHQPRSVHAEPVGDAGRDRLPVARTEADDGRRLGCHGEGDLALGHAQATPGPLGHHVVGEQGGRQAGLVERSCGAHHDEMGGHLRSGAQGTVDVGTEARRSSLFQHHPRPRPEGRVMPDRAGRAGMKARPPSRRRGLDETPRCCV